MTCESGNLSCNAFHLWYLEWDFVKYRLILLQTSLNYLSWIFLSHVSLTGLFHFLSLYCHQNLIYCGQWSLVVILECDLHKVLSLISLLGIQKQTACILIVADKVGSISSIKCDDHSIPILIYSLRQYLQIRFFNHECDLRDQVSLKNRSELIGWLLNDVLVAQDLQEEVLGVIKDGGFAWEWDLQNYLVETLVISIVWVYFELQIGFRKCNEIGEIRTILQVCLVLEVTFTFYGVWVVLVEFKNGFVVTYHVCLDFHQLLILGKYYIARFRTILSFCKVGVLRK